MGKNKSQSIILQYFHTWHSPPDLMPEILYVVGIGENEFEKNLWQ